MASATKLARESWLYRVANAQVWKWRGHLYKYGHRDLEEATAAVHAIILRAMHSHDSSKGASEITWAFIAARHAISRLTLKSRLRAGYLKKVPFQFPREAVSDCESKLEQSEFVAHLMRQIKLSKDRMALTLWCSGQTLLQIGEQWGCSRERMRQRCARALNNIRAYIAAEDQPPAVPRVAFITPEQQVRRAIFTDNGKTGKAERLRGKIRELQHELAALE